MIGRELIDQELVAAADAFPELDLSPGGLAASRARMEVLRRSLDTGTGLADGVEVGEYRTPGSDGTAIRMRVHDPVTMPSKRPAVLALHGGGFVMGAPEMDDGENRSLAHALGSVIVSPDYRLAPESPFPAPLEDCYTALLWLAASADRLGIDPDRIAILGKSAGGGLAAGLALLARDRGEVRLVHQQLVYPMLDDRVPRAAAHVGQAVFRREDHCHCWAAYLGPGAGQAGVSAYAAPARADRLEGLPPTFISVGELDLFHDESADFARRLRAAAVAVELHTYPGAYHGFDMVPDARVSRRHAHARLDALRRAFDISGADAGEQAATGC